MRFATAQPADSLGINRNLDFMSPERHETDLKNGNDLPKRLLEHLDGSH